MLIACLVFALTIGLLLRQAPYHWLLLRLVQAVYLGRSPVAGRDRSRRFVILVPAHNEELGLPATLTSLLHLDYPKELFEVLVISDNCSDQTAAVARASGVSVIERQDSQKKSKGYALEYALGILQARPEPLDAVVIIDADTRVEAQLLEVFAGELARGHDWIQAYYSVSNPDENLKTAMLTYAFALFNGVWLLGQDRLGLGSALRGNGMCFSWSGLARCPWQSYGLAEDLEFSWYLRLRGEKVVFTAAARVFGEMIAGEDQAAASQRQRWEHGRKSLAKTFGAELRARSLPLGKRTLLEADLRMPPLSRYVSLLASYGVAVIAAGFTLPPEAPVLLQLLLGCLQGLFLLFCLTFALYLISPFCQLGLPLRYARSLLRAPFYMLWKLRLSRKRAPASWQRATRKNEGP